VHVCKLHWHDSTFASEPSVVVHDGTEEHILMEAVQKYPLDMVHVVLPHVQGLLLLVVPLRNAQMGTDKQMQ
jgi:hypothetical protein